MATRILFLINSLRPGGAEKVLVNLVNGLNASKYDITIMTLFGGGANKQFLDNNIKLVELYKKAPKGFVFICKFFSSQFLHRFFIKKKYDIEVSYLQGVTTRIIGGAPSDVKAIAWMHNCDRPDRTFKNKREMMALCKRFDKIVSVSWAVDKKVMDATGNILNNTSVIYNTHDLDNILSSSKVLVPTMQNEKALKLVTIGTIYNIKGYPRLLDALYRCHLETFNFHMYFVGDGPQRKKLEQIVAQKNMGDYVTFFGFDKNPYKYLSKADLFICSSYTEGFSGTVSEAAILGVPTLTTDCSGMKEILGNNNEYGVVVENSDEGLYRGIRKLLSNPQLLSHYKEKIKERRGFFSPTETLAAAEELFDNLMVK